MTTMRDKITAAIKAAVTGVGAEFVVDAEWANTGTIYAQYGFDTRLCIRYQFNRGHCTLDLSGPGVVAADPPDGLPGCRVERFESGDRAETVVTLGFQYTEGDRIRTMMGMVTTMARRPSGRLADDQIARLVDDSVDVARDVGIQPFVLIDRYGAVVADLADICAAVTALGYTAKVEVLGGNTIGLVIAAANATWLLTWDEAGSWVMSEDPALTDHVARTPDTETADAVAAWADEIMGSDTPMEVLAEEAAKIAAEVVGDLTPTTVEQLRQTLANLPSEAVLHAYLGSDGITIRAEWFDPETTGGMAVVLRAPGAIPFAGGPCVGGETHDEERQV